MARRVRTTKNLAKRMDLQYFKQPHPFRTWRLWLSILVPVMAIGWFAAERAASQKILSSGPLSAAHAVLGKKCDVCHVTTLGIFRAKVSDDACSTCHDAPAHHADKVAFTASCGSCHVEHKGSFRLASTLDASCTQCHADLRARSGSPQYVRAVKDFDKEHPEFAALRAGARDPGQVKLNHYAHLRPGLAGPHGPVQMDCQDCHRLSATDGDWPYAGPVTRSGLTPQTTGQAMSAGSTEGAGAELRHSRGQDSMLPIVYANQCAGCHVKDLQFDKRFDQAAPHDRPDVVQAFLARKYGDYFAAHPSALLEAVAPERILPGSMKLPLPVPRNRQEWMDQQIMVADRLLFDKGCKLCHAMPAGNEAAGGQRLPVVAKSSIPVRWFAHAEFSHDSHRLLTCTSCHNRVPESRETADILLPGIASCRSCHEEGGPRRDAASGQCAECHSYHDWAKERPTKGQFTIPQLRTGK
ncbi:MAG: cytochrome c3 family protein [Terriglobales bacterium]